MIEGPFWFVVDDQTTSPWLQYEFFYRKLRVARGFCMDWEELYVRFDTHKMRLTLNQRGSL